MRLSSNEVESRNHCTQLTVKLPPLTLSSGSVPVPHYGHLLRNLSRIMYVHDEFHKHFFIDFYWSCTATSLIENLSCICLSRMDRSDVCRQIHVEGVWKVVKCTVYYSFYLIFVIIYGFYCTFLVLFIGPTVLFS